MSVIEAIIFSFRDFVLCTRFKFITILTVEPKSGFTESETFNGLVVLIYSTSYVQSSTERPWRIIKNTVMWTSNNYSHRGLLYFRRSDHLHLGGQP